MIQDYLWDYPGLFGTHGYVYVVMGSIAGPDAAPIAGRYDYEQMKVMCDL